MRSLLATSPVLVLSAGSIFVLVSGLWIRSRLFRLLASLVTLVWAGVLYASLAGKPMQDLFAGMLVWDPFGVFFSVFMICVLFVALVFSAKSAEILDDRRSEYYSILLALGTGLIFMATANHLLMAYLALETVSILSYTLAGFHRERSASVEASLKYVVYGSMASAIMVFGMSLLFGVTGNMTFSGIREFLSTVPPDQLPVMLWVSVLLVFAGIGYKISAAPMHMWTPDVYEGAPTPVSALLSVAPKAAGLALLARFFVVGFTQPLEGVQAAVSSVSDPAAISFHIVGSFEWPRFLMISSIFTMFMGNLAALGQTSVKRILAYSAIAHAGYMLMGLTTQTGAGLAAILFYMVVYCLMNVGAFWITSKVEDTMGGDSLRHFRGLGQRRPIYAAFMGIFIFSLVGLPPFAGFIGKYYLFQAALAREMYGFVLLAGLNSVIALYYYVKIAKAMFLEAAELPFPEGKTPFESRSSLVFIALLAVPNVVFGLYWEPLMNVVREAVQLFVG